MNKNQAKELRGHLDKAAASVTSAMRIIDETPYGELNHDQRVSHDPLRRVGCYCQGEDTVLKMLTLPDSAVLKRE